MITRVIVLAFFILATLVCTVLANNMDPIRDRTYVYNDEIRPWTEQPKIPSDSFWFFNYGHVGTDHQKAGFIQLLSNGTIRVWSGSADLTANNIEVWPGEVNGKKTTVLYNSSDNIEKVIYASFSWGYDDHGILTIYSGRSGERLRAAWKLHLVYYKPEADVFTFFAEIPERPGETVGLHLAEAPF